MDRKLKVVEAPRSQRRLRKPVHRFQIKQRPWAIQPFLVAPVLPGETMQNMLVQSRAVSDPVKNALIGWHLEYFYFYVKHRDLDGRDDFTAMMLDLSKDMSAYNEAASWDYYHFANGINWTKLCLKRIVEDYFRNEGETWNGNLIGNLPAAAINIDGWWDSLIADAGMADVDVDLTVGGDGKITASEIDDTLASWEFLRANNLTQMTYEDYLRTYGVRPSKTELHKPELIRYHREWTYPSNTVDPATGTPSSALSWTVADRADKDRFFTEPGFIIGVSVARPKVYMKLKGSLTGGMNDALSWLPAIMSEDPATSMRKFADNTGPIGDVTDANGYWVDVKDLLLYGDQFVNFDTVATDAGIVALPTAGLQRRYATSADADALFKSAANVVRQDGVVSLSIMGRQTDTT